MKQNERQSEMTKKKLDIFFGVLSVEAARQEIMAAIEKKDPEVAKVVRREIRNSAMNGHYAPERLEQDTLFSLVKTSARWKPLDEEMLFPEDPRETINQIVEAIILTGRAKLLMARRTREMGAVAVLEAVGV